MKIFRTVSVVCAHLSLVWGLMILTFYITDRYNSAMAFIDHDMTKGLLVLLSLSVLTVAAWLIKTAHWKCQYLLRLVVSISAALSAVATLSLLVLDRSMINRFESGLSKEPPLLFANDNVKLVLAALAALAIVESIWLIVSHRKRSSNEVNA